MDKVIANALDLTVLRPTTRVCDVTQACDMVRQYEIRTICVSPVYAFYTVSQKVSVCAVVGFPHGTSTPSQKRNEALALLEDGVSELDVVINYGRLLDGDSSLAVRELSAIVDIARPRGVVVKAVLESCFFTMPKLEAAGVLCIDCGVDFLVTSTGYGLHGANSMNVKALMRAVEGTDVQVKANGGIMNSADAIKFLDLGCTRLGACRML